MSLQVLDLLTSWTARTEQMLKRAIDQMRIGDTGALVDSLRSQVRKKSQDLLIAEHEFLIRGRFRDMGVGRGEKSGRVESRAGNRALASSGQGRRPARWYSRTYWGRLNDLQGAIGYRLMETAIDSVKEAIDQVNVTN